MDETARNSLQQRFLEWLLSWSRIGEWSPNSGSSATQKKIYIGKGRHFYPKSNIAEFLIEAYDLNMGDRVLIQGPTTGSQEIVIEHMMVDGKKGLLKLEI